MARRSEAALALAALVAVACGAPSQKPPPGTLAQPVSSRVTFYESADADLDRLQAYFRETFEANEKEFLGQTGRVQGFGAGAHYPQVWLRDSATLVPAIRYYYPRERMTSWLEEHLSHQARNGELYDWIAAGDYTHFSNDAPQARQVYRGGGVVLSADKNTTEADQESSAVRAAYEIFRTTGDRAWLRKKILDRSLLERLDSALESLRERRLDRRSGLLTNALTADWGDVSPTHADQRAIYLDDQTPVVAGLYTNSLFFAAARQLAALHAVVGDESRAAYWKDAAEAVGEAISGRLWNEVGGFYRIHRLIDTAGAPELPDSADRFALGGNALAVLHEVASDVQAARVFAVAEARREQFGFSTISGTLLPPYPRGFFRHPILREELSYQNGGQWDWFGGRFVLAEFERGHARQARRHLLQIARRVVASGGLFEWYTREDEGRGSRQYSGSAAALARAVIEGLFGIDLGADGFSLRVRLGKQPGRIHVEQPATGRVLSYDYRFDPEARSVSLSYQSNAHQAREIALLLPEGAGVEDVLVDGAPSSMRIEALAADTYLMVPTDRPSGQIELKLADEGS